MIAIAFVPVVLGFGLLALGAELLVSLPEIGGPLVLLGLRLLGRRYEAARRANAWAKESREWVRERSGLRQVPVKFGPYDHSRIGQSRIWLASTSGGLAGFGFYCSGGT